MRMLCFSAALAAAFMIVAEPVSAATLERAGTVQRQKGEASRTHGDDSSPLKEGAAVYAGDIVETGAEARLLIRFADASTLQMGGGGKMEIDEMVYNVHGLSDAPDRQAVNFVEGVFRYVSGAISHNDAFDVAIITPVAMMGIAPMGSGDPPATESRPVSVDSSTTRAVDAPITDASCRSMNFIRCDEAGL